MAQHRQPGEGDDVENNHAPGQEVGELEELVGT
jgi:hypothetical protein